VQPKNTNASFGEIRSYEHDEYDHKQKKVSTHLRSDVKQASEVDVRQATKVVDSIK